MYTSSEVHLYSTAEEINFELYSENGEWDVDSSFVEQSKRLAISRTMDGPPKDPEVLGGVYNKKRVGFQCCGQQFCL